MSSSGNHYIDHHQNSLDGCIDENVTRLVRIAMIGKLKHLVADAQQIFVGESNGREQPVGISGPFQQAKRILMRDDMG